MAYNPITWKDQVVTDPTKYKIIKENGSEEVVNIERVPGEIVQEGTRVTADKLNNIEQGIKSAADLVNDLAGVGRTAETVKKNSEDIRDNSAQMDDLELKQGDLLALTTVEKGNLVGSINEMKSEINNIYSLNNLNVERYILSRLF